MAAGHFAPLSLWAYRPTDLEILQERASPQLGRDGIDSDPRDRAGESTNRLPITLISEGRGGAMSRSFFEDYYNRVYFLPPNVQFGPISATATREVLVWNAYLHDVQLDQVTLVDAAGLSMSGEDVPFVFGALATTTYLLIASTDGEPELDADILFEFDNGETYTLEVTGSRAKVSPFVPNWKASYTIEYQFKTEVFTSRNGREQRRALRSTPRKSLSFQSTPTFSALRAFNDLMASWQNNVIVLPEVPRYVSFTADMDGGGTSVNLSSMPDWLVDEAVVILSHLNNYETRRVEAIAGLQVTFAGSSATDWPEGTKLHPALVGRMASSIRSKRETNAVAVVSVEFDVVPASEPVVALPAAPETFNGRELFTMRPNWGSQPDVSYEGNREDIDYERGIVTVFLPVDFLTRSHRYTFTGRRYEDMLRIEQFFCRMKGQRGEFYMPTWERDIQPKGSTPGGSNSLRIFGKQFAADYEDSTVHKAVAVLFKDGTAKYNVVEDIFPVDDADGSDSVVQCADTWDVELTDENVSMISWLFVWRHATDTLSIEWLTSTVGQVQMTMKTLEDLE